MKYKTILLLLVSLPCFAEQNIMKDWMINQDFDVWVDGGKSLINWGKLTNQSIVKAVYPKNIRKDFSDNQIAANKKYSNQWVRIEGTVNNTKLDAQGRMYTDLTESYVNFKAYISDEDFAASLKPQQKVDMYCFNATTETANECIDYKKLIRSRVTKESISKIKDNQGLNLIVDIFQPTEPFTKTCFEKESSLSSKECQTLLNSKNFQKQLETSMIPTFKSFFQSACGESKTSEKCIEFKEKVNELKKITER